MTGRHDLRAMFGMSGFCSCFTAHMVTSTELIRISIKGSALLLQMSSCRHSCAPGDEKPNLVLVTSEYCTASYTLCSNSWTHLLFRSTHFNWPDREHTLDCFQCGRLFAVNESDLLHCQSGTSPWHLPPLPLDSNSAFNCSSG